MRVIHLRASGGVYGAERVVLALAAEQLRQGMRASLICYEDGARPLSSAARAAGIPAVSIATAGPLDPRAALELHRALAAAGPDLVHSHGYKTDVLLALVRRAGIAAPAVATNHLWTGESWRVRAYEAADALALRTFDAVVAVSRAIRDELARAGIPEGRLRVVRNAVCRAPPRDPVPEGGGPRSGGRTLRVGFVGRLAAQKGLDVLLDAAALLAPSRAVEWTLVGEGPLRAHLERRSRALALDGSLRLLGRRDDVDALLRSWDVLVLPSYREGTPLALLEAMQAGLAVVASAVGGTPDVVEHGRTGLLCPPGDARALAAAVGSLAADRARVEALGAAARDFAARELSIAQMARGYLAVYEAALGAPGAADRASSSR